MMKQRANCDARARRHLRSGRRGETMLRKQFPGRRDNVSPGLRGSLGGASGQDMLLKER